MTSPADEVVTLSFADADAGWYGMATSSGLAVLFRGREVVCVGGEGLTMQVDAAFERWSVAWENCGFEVRVSAVAAPVERGGGSEQLVRVAGTVRSGAEVGAIDAPGQVGVSSALDWSSVSLVRYVGAWLGDGGIVLESQRAERAKRHGEEEVWAALVERGEPVPVLDPRLSTTYDGDGHQRRAGLELWTTEEEVCPLRAAGEVICGSSLDLGELQLDLAFFRWRAHGEVGVGRYDILRKR